MNLGFVEYKVHPIHISIAEVDYFTDKKEIQVGLRIYTDDLEAAIRKSGVVLGLDSSKEKTDSDKYLKGFIEADFKITANIGNGIGEMKYIGKEYEDAATWLYFTYDVNSDIDNIKILNKVILNIYDDQKNIINFRKNRKLIKTGQTYKKAKYFKIEM